MSVDLPPSSSPDVRMRGFARRTTVEAALAWVDRQVTCLPGERISVWQAAGRVLAADVVSRIEVPAFARSMMDGYALQAADTLGATPYSRLELQIIGQSLAGTPFGGAVEPHQAVRIMTGAPLPAGADAVLPAEKVEIHNDRLLVLDEIPPGKNVGQRGEDVFAGSVVLQSGRVLRPQDLGLLSSIGQAEVEVVRKPRVRIVVTGNELLPAGTMPVGARIADANGPMLAALVARDGGCVTDPMTAGNYLVLDEPSTILAAMQSDADVVLVSGGSSVGQEDHAPTLLAKHGELAIHGIAMRPSSPTGMGLLEHRIVLLLPGNPVSCLCAYDFFAGRAIRLLGGRQADWPYWRVRLPLARKLVSQVGRVDYARVRIIDNQVEPLAISGASILSSTTIADGFVVVPADSEGFPAEAEVDVFLYD
ncbi:MAG TPA: gephyrin-like molybdotransferase Glp [Pirellulaceae bacterium]|nr:gephyrin-like molybdotransferase Glp [Pirellulaceae bacterium]